MAQQFCGEGVLDNSKFIFKYFQNIDDLIYLNDAFDKKRKRQFLKNLIVKLVASLPEAQNDARQFTHMHTHPYYYIGTLTYQWPHLRVVCSGNGSMILDIAKCTEHKKVVVHAELVVFFRFAVKRCFTVIEIIDKFLTPFTYCILF